MKSKWALPGEKVFDAFNIAVMLLLSLITVYPLYYILINSLNDSMDAMKGGIYLFVRVFSVKSYMYLFQDKEIASAFVVTTARTVIGTVCSVFFTAMFSYAMSKSHLIGRKYAVVFMIIPMYISGGLIPYYLVIRSLGLIGKFAVLIIPTLFTTFNAMILITNFKGIPKELEESAKIDGANDFTIFIRIILPVSTAVLATIALFNAVVHWQSWFDATIFGGNRLQTLQSILTRIIRTSQIENSSAIKKAGEQLFNKRTTTQSLVVTAMVVTTLPIVFIYPFLQKYFVKGIMVGSLKG